MCRRRRRCCCRSCCYLLFLLYHIWQTNNSCECIRVFVSVHSLFIEKTTTLNVFYYSNIPLNFQMNEKKYTHTHTRVYIKEFKWRQQWIEWNRNVLPQLLGNYKRFDVNSFGVIIYEYIYRNESGKWRKLKIISWHSFSILIAASFLESIFRIDE